MVVNVQNSELAIGESLQAHLIDLIHAGTRLGTLASTNYDKSKAAQIERFFCAVVFWAKPQWLRRNDGINPFRSADRPTRRAWKLSEYFSILSAGGYRS